MYWRTTTNECVYVGRVTEIPLEEMISLKKDPDQSRVTGIIPTRPDPLDNGNLTRWYNPQLLTETLFDDPNPVFPGKMLSDGTVYRPEDVETRNTVCLSNKKGV